jgi:hypothetical protein
MKIIKDDTGAVVGFIGESVMSEHSVNMLEEAIKNDKLSDEMFVVAEEKIGADFMDKARGLGLKVVHCLSDLENCSPIQKEAILANCGTKIFLENEK